MGCSASRFDTLLAKAIEDQSSSSSSSSSCSSSSMFPKSRTVSTCLVHHPPLCKGDSNHLVCLTSSSYGSLVLVADSSSSPVTSGQVSGQLSSSSSYSVINTWELMEGLEGIDQLSEKPGFILNDSGDFIDTRKKPGLEFGDLGCVLKSSSDFIGTQNKKGDALKDFNDSQEKPGSELTDFVHVLKDSSDFIDTQKKPGSKLSDLGYVFKSSCDFIGTQKKPGSQCDVLKDSSDFIDTRKKPGSTLTGFGDFLKDSSDFIDTQKSPGLKLSDFVHVLKNSSDFNDTQKQPGLKFTDVLKESSDFIDTQKNPGSKLSDFVHVLKSSSDLTDSQKNPGSDLGFKLSDHVKKMSESSYVFVEITNEIVEEKLTNSKPLWKHLSEESLLSKMDPNVVSSYQKALLAKKSCCDHELEQKQEQDQPRLMTNYVQAVNEIESLKKSCSSDNASKLPSCEDKIVFYYTSLRGIRRTYEDCCAIRMILGGFRVLVDERDISMDSSYRKEMQSALGGTVVSLPQLFIRGKRIGGADEIKQMHENGKLESLLNGFPIQDRSFVCERCGESRFIPCLKCNGSRKLFHEEEGRMRRCPDCNENGLVRCPWCC